MKRAVLPITLLLLAAACGDNDDTPSTTPPPAATVSPTSPGATPAPTPSPSPEPTTLGIETHRADDTALGNLMVLVETGCYNCDGPPSGIFRAYGYQQLGAKYEWLLRTTQQVPGVKLITDSRGNTLTEGTITKIVASPDTSVIAVSVCVQGSCALDGLDAFDPASITATFRSLDGGVTWSEVDRRGPVAHVVGALADGRVVLSNAFDGAGKQREYILLPEGTPLEPPVPDAIPIVSTDAVPWLGASGVLYGDDGTEFLRMPSSYGDGYPVDIKGTIGGSDPSAIVRWIGDGPRVTTVSYLARINFTNHTVGEILNSTHLVRLGSWLPGLRAAVISSDDEGQPFPALLNIDTGEYSLILNPFNGGPSVDADTGRTFVLGAAEGPFARVTGTNSCLNIRAQPSLAATVLECAADGVLLTHTNQTTSTDTATWLAVTTPAGTSGWASTTYLEY
ncbi:MAG TPA: SH3 domain-containing protein [Dehalococcoidia bacterium]|nr:SH3 domain-containing protein [Dehalococcoidia bacterium]